MVSKTLVLLEDDLDGGEASESLRFAFDDKSYVIDLNEKNAAKFRKAIAPYLVLQRHFVILGRVGPELGAATA